MSTTTPSATDLYGLGTRLGIYLQTLSTLLAFPNIIRLDPKSQFAGTVLALQLPVRWWNRHNTHAITVPEMWIALAELLLFTGPGCLLLYMSFALQRWLWRDESGGTMLRKESVRGQGLNFAQAAVVTVWGNVTNGVFCWWVVAGQHMPLPNAANPIWLLGNRDVRDASVKWTLGIQAAVTMVCELAPLGLYIAAWVESVKDYWDERQGRRRNYQRVSHRRAEWTEFGLPGFLHGRSTWLAILCAGLSTVYVVILVVSIERTIVLAGLRPAGDVGDPGQLLPLVTGAVSFASAVFNTGRPVVRVERFQGGGRTYYAV
ncbi:hypothetical protein PRZ48_010962 [Zasmidium cellare]|uniref:Uncharacterized protein n=1 Tax=Zasmidium cellare TaxID=395010 RepID=A0ABR0EA50_ZASCE|nr:hypothetical protein PRZ48_010962 [Zasmidium cellare]